MTTAALSLKHGGLPPSEILEGLSRLHPLVFVAETDGKIGWMSDRLTTLCGGSDDYVGKHLEALLPGLGAPRFITPREFQCATSTHSRVHLAGAERAVDVILAQLELVRHEQTRIVGVIRSLGEPHACRPDRATDFLTSILDNAPDAVIAVDRAGFVTYANKLMDDLTGHPVSEQLDQPAVTFLPQFERSVGIFGDEGPLDGEELEIRRPDGGTAWVSISARVIRLQDGRSAGTACFIHDVTERRCIRIELERKNAELESYVHSVSHDLRSPLVSLLGFSRLLREDYGALIDDTGLHFIDRIEQAGRTMESLIHDLLELSRIGRSGEHRTLVDPRAVLLQLKGELKLRLDDEGIELRIPASPPLVYCDRTRLYQVFSNLIGNALNHMGPCHDPVIEVEIHTEEDCHRISVSDNGRGIAPADQDRIFEVFTSLGRNGNHKRGGSTGIGLAIVKKIVETHAGRVWVESAPGQGARFIFTLPRH